MEKKEEFREIAGFPGYWVSNLGRIMSTKRKVAKIMAKFKNSQGYPAAAMWEKGELFTIQLNRLVLETFVGYPAEPWLCVVRHKDGDRMNCELDNLEWYICETTDEYDPSKSLRKGVLKPDFTKEKMGYSKMHQSKETIRKQVIKRRQTMQRLNYWRNVSDD
jgi:hypothetical protein